MRMQANQDHKDYRKGKRMKKTIVIILLVCLLFVMGARGRYGPFIWRTVAGGTRSDRNVGLGVDPEGALHVRNAAFPVNWFERTTTGTSAAVTATRVQATTSGNMADGFGPCVVFGIKDVTDVDNDIVLYGAYRDGDDTSGRFQIRTKKTGTYNATGFNIDKNNNVGIGVVEPSSKLEVVGAVTSTGYNVVAYENASVFYENEIVTY